MLRLPTPRVGDLIVLDNMRYMCVSVGPGFTYLVFESLRGHCFVQRLSAWSSWNVGHRPVLIRRGKLVKIASLV